MNYINDQESELARCARAFSDALLPKLQIEIGDRKKVPAHNVGDVVKFELNAQGPIQDGQYGLMTRS
jgi:hypothetical protein